MYIFIYTNRLILISEWTDPNRVLDTIRRLSNRLGIKAEGLVLRKSWQITISIILCLFSSHSFTPTTPLCHLFPYICYTAVRKLARGDQFPADLMIKTDTLAQYCKPRQSSEKFGLSLTFILQKTRRFASKNWLRIWSSRKLSNPYGLINRIMHSC